MAFRMLTNEFKKFVKESVQSVASKAIIQSQKRGQCNDNLVCDFIQS